MAKMTQRIKELFDEAGVAALATAGTDGAPNVVPVGAKKILDDETVLISDQFLHKTLANLQANPRAALTFWSGHEGYQLKGTVQIETAGPRFDATVQWIEELSAQIGFPLKSKGAVILHIDAIYGVTPGETAGERVA